MKRLLLILGIVACGTPDPHDDPPETEITAETARARATRVSMALRGHRPSLDELDRVAQDPASLDALVEDWMRQPAFGETIRHLHADTLLTRSARTVLPALGPLQGEDSLAIGHSMREEPLALAEYIVMNDRPYTEVVTADYTVVDELAPVIFAGLDRQDGPGEQPATYTDGRPAAGILATHGLWVRYQSAGQNYQRQRANAIADTLLCSDFVSRDIPISGEIDLSDPDAVANALTDQPECVACHQTLDPLGSHLFTFRGRLQNNIVRQSYDADCARTNAACYPVQMYFEGAETAWRRLGLRPPGYYGQESTDVGTLGQRIAEDPRFAQCTVRRFVSYFTQTPLDEVDVERAAPLQTRFVDSGFDARALIRDIVSDPAFVDADAPDGAGLLAARPVQLAASIEALTGFRMVVNIDGERCLRAGVGCIGDVDMAQDDAIGFRAMAGGIDGYRVTRPTWTTTPTKTLFLAALAEEAAGHVVDADFAAQASERHLLRLVESDTTEEAAVRAQLAQLHLALYGEHVEADDAQIDEAWALFSAALSRRSGVRAPSEAWKLTLTGLLQDPRMLVY